MTTVALHVVDGTYELFRAFFGAPSALDATGREVGATRGLVQTLLSLLARPEVTHVGCAFDHVIESFRNDLFGGYKTSEGIPVELAAQFELAERATRALGIVTWPMIEFEADDALATAAWRFARDARVERVVVCSPDKDLLQCVQGSKVVCWDRQRDKVYDEAGVVEKLGVLPRLVPDFLALVGDSADGIPGIPRWGKTSAARVLSQVGSLEAIPERAVDLGITLRGADALLASLNPLRNEATLYKRLATLRTDVPLEETLDDLEWRGAPRAELTQFLAEIDATSLAARVSRFIE